jgi:hydroxymethylglutaryl-CoA lyase
MKAGKKNITIVEVGLRDGLQNESVNLFTEVRVEMAKQLALAGVQRMELGAFVRPDWVPQMAGSKEVILQVLQMRKAKELPRKIQFSALVPNEKGMFEALGTHIEEIAIFAASSESFSQKNINCSIEESFERFQPVMALAKKNKIKVRGYLSTCFGCPYEGKVSEERVVRLAARLYKMGCFEISIGDTIGVATPGQVKSLFTKLKKKVPAAKLAGHFHDTRGTALVNILTAYQMGITTFDSSVGGLGGCPYAPGSAGNVATEDVVYMFHGMGVKTGLNLEKLLVLNRWISEKMGKTLPSKVGKVGVLKPLGKVSPTSAR